jgi:hypothetical protein
MFSHSLAALQPLRAQPFNDPFGRLCKVLDYEKLRVNELRQPLMRIALLRTDVVEGLT